MTSTLRTLRVLAIVMPMALVATTAASQPPGIRALGLYADENGHYTELAAPQASQPQGRAHADHAADAADVRAQMAALDARIRMLATDMRMFSGEMKVEIMASLLTAMIERQSLMEREMHTMREGMMRRMMERNELPAASFDEEESGGMCAPSN
jgi:hypothetical protein